MSPGSRSIQHVVKLKALGCIFFATHFTLAANALDQASKEKQPDPRNLLKTVAQARHQIASGEMEFEVTRIDFGHPLEGTNHIRLKVLFDGEKRRFESFSREYHSVLLGPDAGEVTEAKLRELGLVRGEAGVKAGLLRAVDRNRVTTYDGVVLLALADISATERKMFQTTVHDPAKGDDSNYLFDPRILGLIPSPFVKSTIDTCLPYTKAESVTNVGNESVEGTPCWHVRISYPSYSNSISTDLWIDTSHPSRVVKCEWNKNTVLSKFDPAHPEDPIPIEVRAVSFYGTGRRERSEESFFRRATRYNVPLDESSWTLAGLKMPIGTWVVDNRTSRSLDLGYWNGTGLSEKPQFTTNQEATVTQNPPSPAKLLALAEKDPKSPFALAAATWVILNTPDGPAVEKAADIVRREHLRSTNLIYLCDSLVRLRHRSAVHLLRSILEDNPDAMVQARACFSLATMLKGEANEAGDNQAAAEATRLFERVVADYGKVESGGTKLAERAKAELFELDRLGVGRIAPQIEGEDLDGRKMKLDDYRGKVVVLVFWGTWCGPCMRMVPDERKLVERMGGKPFALIGINSDNNKARVKAAVEKEGITWASFRDGTAPGPIAKAWNVQSWPTVYVLDPQGVIRYRNVQGAALEHAVDALIREGK